MTELKMKQWMLRKWLLLRTDQRGVGTLEFLMILTVLVSVAIVFRQWIFSWIGDLLGGISPTNPAPVSGLPTPK